MLGVAIGTSALAAPSLGSNAVVASLDWLVLSSHNIGVYSIVSESDTSGFFHCRLESVVVGRPPREQKFLGPLRAPLGTLALVFEQGGNPDEYTIGEMHPEDDPQGVYLLDDPEPTLGNVPGLYGDVIRGREAILSALTEALERIRGEFGSRGHVWGYKMLLQYETPAAKEYYNLGSVYLIRPPYREFRAEVEAVLDASTGRTRLWALCVLKQCYSLPVEGEIAYLRDMLDDPSYSTGGKSVSHRFYSVRQYAYDRLRKLGERVSRPDSIEVPTPERSGYDCEWWTLRARPAF